MKAITVPKFTNQLAATLVCISMAASAKGANTDKCTVSASQVAEKMQSTSTSLVSNYVGDPKDFKSDGDENTLEIVLLGGKQSLRGSVSADGEVVFIPEEISDDERQQLFFRAFALKVCRKNG